MAKEMNLYKRLTAETPKFFKWVIRVSLSLSVAATAIIQSPKFIPHFTLDPTLLEICKYIVAIGFGAAAVSKTTMVDKPDETKKDK